MKEWRRSGIGLTAACLLLVVGTSHAQQATAPPAKRIAIRAGRLIDGKSEAPITNALILIEGDKIVSVSAGGNAPAGADLIDLSKATVLPAAVPAIFRSMLSTDFRSRYMVTDSHRKKLCLSGLKPAAMSFSSQSSFRKSAAT